MQEIHRKANDLVRLALFSEQRRVPLKRDEINKKGSSLTLLSVAFVDQNIVMGSGTKSFNVVFALAQKTLQDTLGMDLVELHRSAEEQEPEPTQTTDVKKRGMKVKHIYKHITEHD